MTKAAEGGKTLVLKVCLEGSEPAIWRRFEIGDRMTLGDLHYVLQIVMGWTNSHLHEFHIGEKIYAPVFSDDEGPGPVHEEDEVELRDVLKREGATFRYVYDFGDGWVHEVSVENIAEQQPDVPCPRCTGGEWCCPPEDCGGIGGYYGMLEALQDPDHDEYQTYRDWLPDGFDPADFDVALTNNALLMIDEWRGLAEDGDARDLVDEPLPGPAYKEPVLRLLALGEPRRPSEYASLGIGEEHVTELIQMATDMALHRSESEGIEVWAPVHAWRALGELHAEQAAEPLVELLQLVDDDDDDWAGEDLPKSLGTMGAVAIPALSAFLQDSARGPWARIAASASLAHLGQNHSETRDTCVAALTTQLKCLAANDELLNAFLISALVDLEAVESAAVMEWAFDSDAVDLGVQGDWEEVQIALGLLDKRITPRPARGWLVPTLVGTARTRHSAAQRPPAGKKHQKTKKKRKNQKKARRKNRRK